MRSGSKTNLRAGFAAGLLVASLWTVALAGGGPQTPPPSVDTVLAKMDGVSKTFTGMQASIERASFTAFAETTLTDHGNVFFSRKAKETQILTEFIEPRKETLIIAKGKVRIFNPKLNEVREKKLDRTQNQELTEFLLLGFGQPSAEIRRLYDPSVTGTETIEGRKTVILTLKPKASSDSSGKVTDISSKVTGIVLWMDMERWVPVRTQVTQPSKDTTTVTYRDVKMGEVADSVFDPEFPKGVKISPFQQGG